MYRCKTQVLSFSVFHLYSVLSNSLHPLFLPWTLFNPFPHGISLYLSPPRSSASVCLFCVFYSVTSPFLAHTSPAIASLLCLIFPLLLLSCSLSPKSVEKMSTWKAILLCRVSVTPAILRQLLFSSTSSAYHTVDSVRIQRQDEHHSFVPGLCTSSSGHWHTCLSSCPHILIVAKEEKKENPFFIHSCLGSFLLVTPPLVP